MKTEETIKILSVVKANYREYFKDMKKEEANALLSSWDLFFKDYSYQNVSAALYIFIDNDVKGYPPKIGMLKDIMRKSQRSYPTEEEAWQKVIEAVRDSRCASKYFNQWPKPLQIAVGGFETIKGWGQSTDKEFNGYIHSQFKKDYQKALQEYQTSEQYKNTLLSGTASEVAKIDTK